MLSEEKRAEIKRIRNRAIEAGVSVVSRTFESTNQEAVEALIKNILHSHGIENMFSKNVISLADQMLKNNDYRHLIAILNNKIIGTVTIFCSNDTAIVRWAGLESSKTKGTYAYHYLMSETIASSIELGAKYLRLGGTVLTLKKQLGAEIVNRNILLDFKYPLINALLKPILYRL